MSQDVTNKEGISELEKRQTYTEWLMIGVFVVLFLAFVGLSFALGIDMADGYRSREASYTDLVQTINTQNIQINLLLEKLNKK